MYTFRVVKPQSVSTEQFESAINCARVSVESVLDDETLYVKVDGDLIIVCSSAGDMSIPMTLVEIQNKIKGCFAMPRDQSTQSSNVLCRNNNAKNKRRKRAVSQKSIFS